MNPNRTSVHELRSTEVAFTAEARRVQGKALSGQACVVRLGQIVFFSTETGDAWMLDPEDGYAVCLARDYEPRRIPIRETAANLTIDWDVDYTIEGQAFSVADRHGAAQTILGYPTAEIQRLVRELPAIPRETSSDTDQARMRLKSSRNDPCPCGSGKKYKKCCLPRDEALVRQSVTGHQTQTVQRAESATPIAGDVLDVVEGGTEFSDEGQPLGDLGPELAPEVRRRADALWDAFEALGRPTAEQMDAFLANLLALPPEATSWNELFHLFARHEHPDLPGVFDRIASAVRPTKETSMAFFYWAASEEFVRHGSRHLLPEVAARFRTLQADSYNPDALIRLEDYLLADGFDAETLELAEHFLPILRADAGLMSYVAPDSCELIFELRVGRHLRAEPNPDSTSDLLAEALLRGIEEEVHPDVARGAADLIAGRAPVPMWTERQFDFVSADTGSGDKALRESQRLFAVLMHVARDAWHVEQRPPGCVLRGLALMLNSVYDGLDADRKHRKRVSKTLLDSLQPAGLEQRLVRACDDLIGVNAPRARLLLDAHGVLLRFAVRHHLVAEADAARSQKELARLHEALHRLK